MSTLRSIRQIRQLEAGLVLRVWSVTWRPRRRREPDHTTQYLGPFWVRVYRDL